MKASAFEFRIRFLLHGLVFLLGFWAPWNALFHPGPNGPNAHLWGTASVWLSQTGLMNISAAFNLLLVLGIVLALAGAALRTWGAAYLGRNIVQDASMHTGALTPIVSDGPYRRLRNPLYLGTFLHTLALALLMPPSGAVFAVILIAFMQVRLILGEEAFLTARLGAPYQAYKALVPRLLPSLHPRVAAAGQKPRWPQAFLGEIYMWGVFASFALAGWRYDASLLIQCVLVSVGLSLIVRALKPRPRPTSQPAI
jgi:protein-S-isoprenylcysteine O-methyltransferase Ste14